MKNQKKPKLEVSLIPASAWGRNVRAVVSQQIWEDLRWQFGASRYSLNPTDPNRSFLVCETCGVEKKVDIHLHELWEFNDQLLVQKLVGFKAVCENCHNAIHFGRAMKVGLGEDAIDQLAKVNEWTDKQILSHIEKSAKLWEKREGLNYDLNLAWLQEQDLVPENKIRLDWLSKPQKVYDRIGAISWAQRILSNPNVVILDTETTGLMEGPMANPNAEVVELAITSIGGKALYNGRFKPRYSIPQRTTEIHGITNQAVKNSPKFSQEFPKILQKITGKIVICYNARFDEKVIANTCKLCKLDPPDDVMWDCAMKVYKAYQAPNPWFSKLPNAKHSALSDCKATLELIKSMSRNEKIINKV